MFMRKQKIYSVSLLLAVLVFVFSVQKQTARKENNYKMYVPASVINGSLSVLANTYSSEVALKWIDVQLELMRTSSPFIGGLPPSRPFAYSGIALYEAIVPGMPDYQTLSGQLADMPTMPATARGVAYHWPTCANAALAAMTRSFFSSTSDANKTSVTALENEFNKMYKTEAGEEVFQRSVQFGKAVAQVVFGWSKTDGAANANAPFTPPVGPGLWAPTPPGFAPAFGPYWGNNRLLVAGSLDGTMPDAPPAFSTDPASDYYQMVKEVYDISQTLTADQTALALFYRDYPGFGDGHYLSILKQILEHEKPKLDFTASVLAKTGIACVDAGIGCWRTKFRYNQQRPIKYIREVLGHPEWNTLFDTPPFPDFPSGHSAIAGSFGEILKGFFGNNYHFTDHTYDYLGMAPRSYNSFDALAKEIGDSRVYAGIHYRYSCEKGCEQGRKIGQNIAKKLHFKR
jgi:hypothetical protein